MPGSACHNDLTPSMGKRGLMSLAVAQRMRSLYTSLPEARPKAVLDSVRKQFGPVNVGLRAVRERKRMMRPCTSLGELAAAVAPHAVWPPLDSLHEGFFAHCLFPLSLSLSLSISLSLSLYLNTNFYNSKLFSIYIYIYDSSCSIR